MKVGRKMKVYPLIGDDKEGDNGNTGNKEVTAPVVIKKDEKTGHTYYELDGVRLFTQEHMNKEIGQARIKASEANKTLIQQLEELQQKATTTEAVKEELEQQIQTLKSKTMTKEEQMIQQIQELQTNLKTTQEKLTQERDTAYSRWQEERITNELQLAALDHPVFSFEQIFSIVRPKTQLREVVDDDGKATGEHEVIVTLDVPDDKGVVTTKELAPAQALETMKGMKNRYANLFINQEVPGVGGTNNTRKQGASDTPGPEDLASQEAYDAWKKRQGK